MSKPDSQRKGASTTSLEAWGSIITCIRSVLYLRIYYQYFCWKLLLPQICSNKQTNIAKSCYFDVNLRYFMVTWSKNMAFFCGVIWQKINSRENTTPRSMKSLNIYCRYIAHRFNSFSLLRGHGTSFEATESGRDGEAVHEFGMDGTPNFALGLDFWEANEKAGASCHVKGSKIQENPPVFCQLFSMCPLKRRSESRGLCI